MAIYHVASIPIHVDLLSDFYNLHSLHLIINEMDLENVKNRLLELAQCFRQANLENLRSFVLDEKSSFGYAKDLIPAWIDFFNAIPSNILDIVVTTNNTDQNQLTTRFQSPNSLSLAYGIARLTCLEFLTIYHLGFDSSFTRILPSLCKLRKLDLCINMDMSNKNGIDELCHNLEKCSSLEWIAIYVPAKPTMVFGNVFASLAKIQTFRRITLYFDSFEKILRDECFEKLSLIKKLLHVDVRIKRNELNRTNTFSWACGRLRKKMTTFVPIYCRVSICECD
jgi:hypothetical protein